MRGDPTHPTPTSIGALTRGDRHREAILRKKIGDAYRTLPTTSSNRARRRHLRRARRHERALLAQRRRPHSVLAGGAAALAALCAVVVLTRLSFTLFVVFGMLLVADLGVLRRRRRVLRRP